MHATRHSSLQALSSEFDPHRDYFGEAALSFAGCIGVHLSVGVVSVPGHPERANEDSFAISALGPRVRISVHDGTTYLGAKIPGLARTPAFEAAQFLRRSLLSETSCLAPHELLLRYNAGLLEHARELLAADTPLTSTCLASTASMVDLDMAEGVLRFGHVSDTFIMARMTDGSTRLLTNDTNAQFDEEVFALMRRLSTDTGIAPRNLRQHPEVTDKLSSITRSKNNRPDRKGTGLLNGDPNVEHYVQSGTLALAEVSEIILGTDGSVPLGWSLAEESCRRNLLSLVGPERGKLSDNLSELISLKRALEASDPDWHRHLRWKPSDDATLVYCKLEHSGALDSQGNKSALASGEEQRWPARPDGELSETFLRRRDQP